MERGKNTGTGREGGHGEKGNMEGRKEGRREGTQDRVAQLETSVYSLLHDHRRKGGHYSLSLYLSLSSLVVVVVVVVVAVVVVVIVIIVVVVLKR